MINPKYQKKKLAKWVYTISISFLSFITFIVLGAAGVNNMVVLFAFFGNFFLFFIITIIVVAMNYPTRYDWQLLQIIIRDRIYKMRDIAIAWNNDLAKNKWALREQVERVYDRVVLMLKRKVILGFSLEKDVLVPDGVIVQKLFVCPHCGFSYDKTKYIYCSNCGKENK